MANDNFDLPRPTDAVPSATSAVINDDSKVLDYVVNGTGTVSTRTGKQIMTIDQAIQSAAPVPLNGGVWASGQTFEFYNQYMYYDGIAYATLPATTLPYTVGATPDLGFVYQIKLNDHSLFSNRDAEEAHLPTATGSLTPRSLNDRAADYVHVRDFGAVGDFYLPDGSENPSPTDDTAAFQLAIDTGKSVYLGNQSNAYVINGVLGLPDYTIRSKDRTHIYADGAQLVINSREAAFTSKNTILDPEIVQDLHTANYEWSGIAFLSRNQGVVFNGDRIYDSEVHHCSFQSLGAVIKSFRQKDTTGFQDDGYIQSFAFRSNRFTYCNKILDANKAYNFDFIGNVCETVTEGLIFFGDSSCSKVSIENNLFENGGLFLYLNALKSRALSVSGNYLEKNESGLAASRKCQIDLRGLPYPSEEGFRSSVKIEQNHLHLQPSDVSDPDYVCIRLESGVEYEGLTADSLATNWTNHNNYNVVSTDAMSSFITGENLLMNSGFDSVSISDYTLTSGNYVADMWQTRSAAAVAKSVLTIQDDKGSNVRFGYASPTENDYLQQDIPASSLGWSDISSKRPATLSMATNFGQETDVNVFISWREMGSTVDLNSVTSQTISIGSGVQFSKFSVNLPELIGSGSIKYKLTVRINYLIAGKVGTVVIKTYRAKLELGSLASAYSRSLRDPNHYYRAGDFETDVLYQNVIPALEHRSVISMPGGNVEVPFIAPDCTNVRIYETNGTITNVDPNDVTLENINNNSAVRITYSRGTNYSGIAGVDNLVSVADI